MRKRVMFGLVAMALWLACDVLPAQAGSWNGWVYQNPYPAENILLAVKFVTPQQGWIAGVNGTILYTKDGGETWETQDSGVGEDIKSIAFVNEKQGWAVGNGGVIIHTEDGGGTWRAQNSDTSASLNKVFFIDEKEGWIVGATHMGVVLHTKDGGKNWEKQNLGIYRSIASVYFLDRETGWILAGDEVYRTTDGGKTWEKSSSIGLEIKRPTRDETGNPVIVIGEDRVGYDWWEGDIYFTDKKKGWVVFGYWYVSHTEDGGKSWQTEELKHSQGHIAFTDDKHGCLAGTSILCTEDGGEIWKERLGYKTSDSSNISLWCISFVNQSIGWAVGKEGYGEGSGKLFKTEDGGKTWQVKSRGYEVFSCFINSKTGWNVQYDDKAERSSIVRTDDGGNTWRIQKEFDNRVDAKFYFISPDIGWVVGTTLGRQRGGGDMPLDYFILNTKDGGKNWVKQYDEPVAKDDNLGDGLFDIHFINADTGWVVGSKGRILHTRDGGKHWERQKSGTKLILHKVFFSNEKQGVIVGDAHSVLGEDAETDRKARGVILHTADGGLHWNIAWEKRPVLLRDIFIVDRDAGMATAETLEGSREKVLFLRSKDGGKTWMEEAGNIAGKLIFLDKKRGVLLPDGNYLYLTNDGGQNWVRKARPIHKHPWHISELFK